MEFYRPSEEEVAIVKVKDKREHQGANAHARSDHSGRDQRADQKRTLFRLPVSGDGGLLRVGKPLRLRALEADSVARGDSTRDEVLRLHPGLQRPGRSAVDRAAGRRVRLASGGV